MTTVLKLVLELLVSGPSVVSEVETMIADIKTSANGTAVLTAILDAVKQIAASLEKALGV